MNTESTPPIESPTATPAAEAPRYTYNPNRAQRRALAGAAKRHGIPVRALTKAVSEGVMKGYTFEAAIAHVTSKRRGS